ncbi:hypothetical protein [Candidatus Hodgkinia cicadicola]|uniref:hypothetical protein n=1 Tax=Candidatus Hodgkinia cicadicola TaxID=573658 RepID=UPI001788A9F7
MVERVEVMLGQGLDKCGWLVCLGLLVVMLFWWLNLGWFSAWYLFVRILVVITRSGHNICLDFVECCWLDVKGERLEVWCVMLV